MSEKYIVHTLLKKSFNFRDVNEEHYVNMIRLNQFLCRKHYPEFKLHLHADQEGIVFLKRHGLLNYDTFSISDISNILDSSYKNLFAAGKIELFSFFNKPFIHIDLDLLFLGKVEFNAEKIIISHYERVNFNDENSYNSWLKWYYNDYIEIKEIDNYMSFINLSYSSNFSIFGTFNEEYLKKINEHYSKILNIIKDNHKKLDNLHGSSSILEQLSLNKIAQESDISNILNHFKPIYVVEYGKNKIRLELPNETSVTYYTDNNDLLKTSGFQLFVKDFFNVFDGKINKVFHVSEKAHKIMNELIMLIYNRSNYNDISGYIKKYDLLMCMKNLYETKIDKKQSLDLRFLYDRVDEIGCAPNLCDHNDDYILREHDGVKFYDTIINFLPSQIKDSIRYVETYGNNVESYKNLIYPIDVLAKFILSPNIRLDPNRPQITTLYDDIKLNDQVVKLVQNKKCKIVLFYFTEGYYGMTDIDFETVENMSERYKFDTEDVIVVTANLMANKEYENYQVKNNKSPKFTIHELNYFFKSIWFLSVHTDEDVKNLYDSVNEKMKGTLTTKKEKLFLNYNRRPHYHRIVLATELLSNPKLKDLGWVSLGNRDISNSRNCESFKDTILENKRANSGLDFDRLAKFWETHSDLVDIKVDSSYLYDNQSHHIDLELHQKSFLSVVSETIVEDRAVFFSEKTAKPIFCCQPFILFSSPGSLKKLKELGFMTFGEFWDESYDDEVDFTTRIHKISKVLETLASKTDHELYQMLLNMEPILRYNYKKLIDGMGDYKDTIKLLTKNKKFL